MKCWSQVIRDLVLGSLYFNLLENVDFLNRSWQWVGLELKGKQSLSGAAGND